MHLMCRSLAVGAQSILPLNLRMNRSLSHFACGGEGVGLVFELLGDALDEFVIAAVEQMLVGRAMPGNLLPRIAIHAGIDADVECADRWGGDDRALAAVFAAVGKALLVGAVVDTLHLGGVELRRASRLPSPFSIRSASAWMSIGAGGFQCPHEGVYCGDDFALAIRAQHADKLRQPFFERSGFFGVTVSNLLMAQAPFAVAAHFAAKVLESRIQPRQQFAHARRLDHLHGAVACLLGAASVERNGEIKPLAGVRVGDRHQRRIGDVEKVLIERNLCGVAREIPSPVRRARPRDSSWR